MGDKSFSSSFYVKRRNNFTKITRKQPHFSTTIEHYKYKSCIPVYFVVLIAGFLDSLEKQIYRPNFNFCTALLHGVHRWKNISFS